MNNKKKKIMISVIVVFSLVWAGMIAWKILLEKKAEAQQESGAQYSLYSIPAFPKVFLEGELQHTQQEEFYPEASRGQIDTINVTDQQAVEKDQVLFTYKNEQAIEQYEDLKLQLESLVQTQKQLKKQLAEASSVQVVANPVGDESVMPPTNNTEEMKNTITSQINENVSQQKRLNVQLNNLNGKQYSSVTAPFPGIVSIGKSRNEGEQQPILSLTAPTLQVAAYVSEKDRQRIHKDQPATILIYGTGQEIEGKIREIGDFASQGSLPTSGTQGTGTNLSQYPVYIDIPQQAGLYAGYHIQGKVTPDNELPKIPKSSFIAGDGGSFVWEVVDGKAKKTQVETQNWNAKYVLVKSGLQPGQIIIREGTNDIKEGDKIDISSLKN
jgi:HlyD family secretion protein